MLAKPVPARLIAAGCVHGDAAGQQHLRAEVHAVPAVVIIGHKAGIAPSHIGQHIVPGGLPVIGMVGGDGDGQPLPGQVAAGLDVVGDSGEMVVLPGSAVIVGAVIGVVVGHMGDDAPAVAAGAAEGEGVLDAQLLRGDAVQPGEIDHVALLQHHVHVALRLRRRSEGRTAQGIAVGGHGQVDGRQAADDAQVVPDGLVVHRLVHSGEQIGGVNDLQRGDGLIIAVHEVQQQQLLAHSHALIRRAADALEGGADRGGIAAPHRAVAALPRL